MRRRRLTITTTLERLPQRKLPGTERVEELEHRLNPVILGRKDMKRQRLISKGSLSRLFQEAAEAWRRQEYAETTALLERASRLDPANASVLLDLGRAY